MQIFSDLLLRMYGHTLTWLHSCQADSLVDAKYIFDYYLNQGHWPEVFYIYYRKQASNLYLPNVTTLNNIRYGFNVDPQGVLVKYTLSNDHYETQYVPITELYSEEEMLVCNR